MKNLLNYLTDHTRVMERICPSPLDVNLFKSGRETMINKVLQICVLVKDGEIQMMELDQCTLTLSCFDNENIKISMTNPVMDDPWETICYIPYGPKGVVVFEQFGILYLCSGEITRTVALGNSKEAGPYDCFNITKTHQPEAHYLTLMKNGMPQELWGSSFVVSVAIIATHVVGVQVLPRSMFSNKDRSIRSFPPHTTVIAKSFRINSEINIDINMLGNVLFIQNDIQLCPIIINLDKITGEAIDLTDIYEMVSLI